MPAVNVYLPDDLAEQLRRATLPVSQIAQSALRRELERMTTIAKDPQLQGFIDRAIKITVPAGPQNLQYEFEGCWVLETDYLGTEYRIAVTARGRFAVYINDPSLRTTPSLDDYDTLDKTLVDLPGPVAQQLAGMVDGGVVHLDI